MDVSEREKRIWDIAEKLNLYIIDLDEWPNPVSEGYCASFSSLDVTGNGATPELALEDLIVKLEQRD
jgi:hypothetical protein